MGLGSNLCHTTSLLCALGKVTSLLWASLISSINAGGKHDLAHRAVEREMKGLRSA